MTRQERFEEFRQSHAGEYDIPDTFNLMVSAKEKENEIELDSTIMSGKSIPGWLRKKVSNASRRLGCSDEETLDDYRLAKNTNNSHFLFYMRRYLVKNTTRQNLGERYCEHCFSLAASHECDFFWNRLNGATWINEDGKIVSHKPQVNVLFKSIDYSATSGAARMYFAQKRIGVKEETNVGGEGGMQTSQIMELIAFSRGTKNAKDYLPIAILDGDLPLTMRAKFEKEITSCNDKIIVLQSNDLRYLIEWIEHEATIRRPQVLVSSAA